MYVRTPAPAAFAGGLLVAALLLTEAPASGFTLASDRDADGYGVARTLVMDFLGVPGSSVAIHGWSRQVDNPVPPTKKTTAKNMSLCVPLIAEDRGTFRSLFVARLRLQTVMPSELVVAISGISKEDARKFEVNLRTVVRHIPVIVTSVGHKAMPGENRNRCVAHSHGDVITFFDSDDIMHSRRIEILDYIFQLYKPKVVVHSLSHPLAEISNAPFEVVSARTTKYDYKGTIAEIRHATLAQGWATISRDVFDSVHYNETMRIGEDIQFLSDILETYGAGPNENTLVCVNLPLGEYIARRVRQNITEEFTPDFASLLTARLSVKKKPAVISRSNLLATARAQEEESHEKSRSHPKGASS